MYQTNWDLSRLLINSDLNLIQEELEEMKKSVNQFRDKWLENKEYTIKSKALFEALQEYETLIDKYFPLKVGYYAFLRLELNQSDEEAKKLDAQITEENSNAENLIQFFEITLSKIPHEIQEEFLNDTILNRYRHYLQKLFEAGKHTLSDAEEKIMNLKATVSHGRWESMTSEILAKQKKEVLQEDGNIKACSYNEILNLFLSKDHNVRKSAFQAVKEIYLSLTEVGVAEMNAILENKKIDDTLRKYDSAEDARFLSDDFDKEVVTNLVSVIYENYSIVERYYTLKAKLLNMEKLGYEDRNAPIGNFELKLNFEEAMEFVKNVFHEIHPNYSSLLEEFANDGLIDVFPKDGKHHGAFCVKGSKQIPPYILLNYEANLSNIETLAHEAGHAINHHYINNNNSGVNRGSSTAIAEVASTFFEGKVLSKLEQKTSDNAERLSLMMNRLNNVVNTVFRQISFYEIEKDMHREFRKKYNLSLEEYDKIFITNIKRFSNNYFDDIENLKGFWIGIPHFRYFFYVYSYASGFLISEALSYLLKNDKTFVEKIQTFLSAGSQKSPYELFLEMGIDLKNKGFWEGSILEIKELLSKAETLAEKLNYKLN